MVSAAHDARRLPISCPHYRRSAFEDAYIPNYARSVNHCIEFRSKLRHKKQALCKAYTTPISNSLTDHPNWNEISTLIRLALVAGHSSAHTSSNQLYVPEIIHLVTIVAGFGPALVRKSVYGIIMNLLQSLYVSNTEGSRTDLLQLITECTHPATLYLFGLRRETPTSEYTSVDPANDKDALDTQERLIDFLVRILETTSGSNGV